MNSNGSNGSTKDGNTKRPSPSKMWCFTYNNYTQKDYEDLIKLIGSNKYIIGEEVGEKGTQHLQGYIKFDSKVRPLEQGFPKKIHWEKCKGSEKENIKYCSKDGKYKTNMKIPKPIKVISNEQLYPYQKFIIDYIKGPINDREIVWIFNESGNIGKTALCKKLVLEYQATIIEGKKADILYCASEFESEVYLFDFERSMENYISYAAMEKIKNGLYMVSKYESKPVIRNAPHIICFANFMPDIDKLSKDRWAIYGVDSIESAPVLIDKEL